MWNSGENKGRLHKEKGGKTTLNRAAARRGACGCGRLRRKIVAGGSAPTHPLGAEPQRGLGRSPSGGSGDGAPSYILAAKPPGAWGGAPAGVWGRSPQLHSCGEAAGGLGAELPASHLRRSRPQEHCKLSCFAKTGQYTTHIMQ